MTKFKDLCLIASSKPALDRLDLQQSHVFSLKDVLTHNPSLNELLRLSNVQQMRVAAGSGAFLPNLISTKLNLCRVLLFNSLPSVEEAIQLTEIRPIIFVDKTNPLEFERNYIGWPIKSTTLCICEDDLVPSVGDADANGFTIIIAVSGDTLSVGGFNSMIAFTQMIDNVNNINLTLLKDLSTLTATCTDDADFEIDFGEPGSDSRCIGPEGLPASIMRISLANQNALHVPKREVVAWTTSEDAVESITEDSEVWEWLHNPNTSDSPVVGFASGSDIRSIIPTSCHSFPLLAIHLPRDMRPTASSFANGKFFSENVTSQDLMTNTCKLCFGSEQQSVALNYYMIQDFLDKVDQEKELIIAVRCGSTIWIKYYSDNMDWLEQLWLTKAVGDNYKPRSTFSS